MVSNNGNTNVAIIEKDGAESRKERGSAPRVTTRDSMRARGVDVHGDGTDKQDGNVKDGGLVHPNHLVEGDQGHVLGGLFKS